MIAGFLAKYLSGLWGYAAAAILSAAVAGYAGYQITAWAKDETISSMKLADAQSALDAANAAAAAQKKSDAITEANDLANAKSQQQIQTVTQTVIQKVPVYVTQKADADCVLPNGFVQLLDAAGLGIDPSAVPGAASEPVGADSGLHLSQAAALLAQNLGNYAALRLRIKNALDDWNAQRVAAQPSSAASSQGQP